MGFWLLYVEINIIKGYEQSFQSADRERNIIKTRISPNPLLFVQYRTRFYEGPCIYSAFPVNINRPFNITCRFKARIFSTREGRNKPLTTLIPDEDRFTLFLSARYCLLTYLIPLIQSRRGY